MEPITMNQDGFIERLCRTHQAQLTAYLTQMVGSYDIAQELAQTSFEYIYKTYKQCDVLFPRAMLFQVATNFALMHLRRRRVERRMWREPIDLDYVKDELPDVHAVPLDRQIMADQIADHLSTAIKKLHINYRRVLLMAHMQAKSRRQIAAKLGVSEKRIDKRMTKALRKCRQSLAVLGIDYSDIDCPHMVVHRVSKSLARRRR